MNYLKVPGKAPFPISKAYFTVGGGPSFDLEIDVSDCLAFALHQAE